jgi:hypothetical protein
VEEWLLLDGITLHATDIAPWNIQRPTAVITNLAHAGLTVGNRACVAAGVTAHPIAVQFFVKLTLADILVDDIAKSSQREPLRTKPEKIRPDAGSRNFGQKLMLLDPIIRRLLGSHNLGVRHARS